MHPNLCKELWTGPVEVVSCLLWVTMDSLLPVGDVVDVGAVTQTAQHHTPGVVNEDVAPPHCPVLWEDLSDCCIMNVKMFWFCICNSAVTA